MTFLIAPLSAALIACTCLIGFVCTWFIWKRQGHNDPPPDALVELMIHLDRVVRVTTPLGEYWTGTLEKVYFQGPESYGSYGIRLRSADCRESGTVTHRNTNVWLAWSYIGSIAVED